MSSTAAPPAAVSPAERLEVLFAELAGQRNAIDGRIVEIVAEMDRDELCGATGARSVAALVAWKLGLSSGTAHTIASVARQYDLGFIPVQDEHYDFAVPEARLERPAVQRFRALLGDAEVRAELAARGFGLVSGPPGDTP